MAQKKTKGKIAEEKLIDLLRQWKSLEIFTIRSCDTIINKTDNPIVSTFVNAIRADSAKHKSILELLIDSMTKKAIHLTPEEIGELSSLFNKHIALEKKSIQYAENAIEKTVDPVTKQLLKNILEDEKKHEKIITQLNEFKIRALAGIT